MLRRPDSVRTGNAAYRGWWNRGRPVGLVWRRSLSMPHRHSPVITVMRNAMSDSAPWVSAMHRVHGLAVSRCGCTVLPDPGRRSADSPRGDSSHRTLPDIPRRGKGGTKGVVHQRNGRLRRGWRFRHENSDQPCERTTFPNPPPSSRCLCAAAASARENTALTGTGVTDSVSSSCRRPAKSCGLPIVVPISSYWPK